MPIKDGFSGNIKDGFGTAQCPANNNICDYEGQWWGGKPHGTGALKWANGNAYTGQLNEGNTHGQGIFTFADEASWEGTWDKSKAVGPGVWCFSGGLQVDGAGPEPGCSRRTAAPAEWREAARPQAVPAPEAASEMNLAAAWNDAEKALRARVKKEAGEFTGILAAKRTTAEKSVRIVDMISVRFPLPSPLPSRCV